MERFEDPALFEQLSSIEKLQGGLITTLLGMGLTFIVLALLWALIAIMAKVLTTTDKPQSDTALASMPVAAAAVAETAGKDDPMADQQLVAVITAAIMASQGSGFKNNLVVRKINRVSGKMPPWNGAGTNEAIDSRRM